MEALLLKAVIFITLALIFYSIGVWAEKIQGELKLWHLILFYFGLICDTLGTHFMTQLSNASFFTLHGLTGFIALVLMFLHAIWATRVLLQKDADKMKNFHNFSLIVWAIWLIPYFLGMFLGMG